VDGYDILYTVNGEKHVGSTLVMPDEDIVIKATYVSNAVEPPTGPSDGESDDDEKNNMPIIISVISLTVVLGIVMLLIAFKVPARLMGKKGGE